MLYVIVTYSMAFTAGTPFVGGFSRAFLQGILSDISKGIGNPERAGADDPRDRSTAASR